MIAVEPIEVSPSSAHSMRMGGWLYQSTKDRLNIVVNDANSTFRRITRSFSSSGEAGQGPRPPSPHRCFKSQSPYVHPQHFSHPVFHNRMQKRLDIPEITPHNVRLVVTGSHK